jgi:hypothetical protein
VKEKRTSFWPTAALFGAGCPQTADLILLAQQLSTCSFQKYRSLLAAAAVLPFFLS